MSFKVLYNPPAVAHLKMLRVEVAEMIDGAVQRYATTGVIRIYRARR